MALALVLSIAIVTGCAGKPMAIASPAYRYVRQNSANKVAIVFVHGILGDAESTWTSVPTGMYWPQLLVSDSAFDSANIYVFEFTSTVVGRTYSIDEVAENLRLVLNSDRIFRDHDQVMFIAHSMGGLIVRSLLLKYRDLAAKVPMVYFFATPTTGSAIANVMQIFSRNPQARQISLMQSDEFLADLQRNWLAAKLRIRSYCAYETRPTFGIMAVSQASATNLCSEPLDPIDSDHVDIVKPRTLRDATHMAFRSAFEESVSNTAAAEIKKTTPRFTEADTHRVVLGSNSMEIASLQTHNLFVIDGEAAVRATLRDGRILISAQLFAGGGLQPMRLEENRYELLNGTWDVNANESALEIVNDVGAPVLQVVYRTPRVAVVYGVFWAHGKIAWWGPQGGMINPNPPPTQDTWPLKPMFKYPSRQFPGREVSGDAPRLVAATTNLSARSNDALRNAVGDLARDLREMGRRHRAQRDEFLEQGRANASSNARKLLELFEAQRAEFSNVLRPIAVNLRDELLRRVPNAMKLRQHNAALDGGLLAGPDPLGEAAEDLEALARKLPE